LGRGIFFGDFAMRETSDFFQKQVEQCHALAARAGNKSDRDFWLQLAHRWETLLQAGGAGIEAEHKPGFERPIFRKKTFRFAKRRAA
jgi:hypothetical protein